MKESIIKPMVMMVMMRKIPQAKHEPTRAADRLPEQRRSDAGR
jgi:hypothetical protein